jgi:hypothetical protein
MSVASILNLRLNLRGANFHHSELANVARLLPTALRNKSYKFVGHLIAVARMMFDDYDASLPTKHIVMLQQAQDHSVMRMVNTFIQRQIERRPHLLTPLRHTTILC